MRPTCRLEFKPYMTKERYYYEQNNWNRFRNN